MGQVIKFFDKVDKINKQIASDLEAIGESKLIILNQKTSQSVCINLAGEFPEDKTMIDAKPSSYEDAVDLLYVWCLNKEQLIFFPQSMSEEIKVAATKRKQELLEEKRRKREESGTSNVLKFEPRNK